MKGLRRDTGLEVDRWAWAAHRESMPTHRGLVGGRRGPRRKASKTGNKTTPQSVKRVSLTGKSQRGVFVCISDSPSGYPLAGHAPCLTHQEIFLQHLDSDFHFKPMCPSWPLILCQHATPQRPTECGRASAPGRAEPQRLLLMYYYYCYYCYY